LMYGMGWVACLIAGRLCDCHPGRQCDVRYTERMDGWRWFRKRVSFHRDDSSLVGGKLKIEQLI
jgi:hypothetical protein